MTSVRETTHYRVCPLCEATCGLTITTRGREIVSVRGNNDDVFSRGYICPKAAALKPLDADPDRLRRPLVRRDGRFEEVGWDEAFAEIHRRLPAIQRAHGKEAVAGCIELATAVALERTADGRVVRVDQLVPGSVAQLRGVLGRSDYVRHQDRREIPLGSPSNLWHAHSLRARCNR